MDKEGDFLDASLAEWELLPDHKSFSVMEDSTGYGHGHNILGDQETKKILLPSPMDDDAHEHVKVFKDIGVVPPAPPPDTESKQEEFMPKVIGPLVSHREEEELFKGDAAKKADDHTVVMELAADCGEEKVIKRDMTQSGCSSFSVGKLRVNGIGTLCSFGVAAVTVCIFLLGGTLQHKQQQEQKNQNIQFQICGDDKRIHQVVPQASRLNQAMSSVMEGTSTRASISFGARYDGF